LNPENPDSDILPKKPETYPDPASFYPQHNRPKCIHIPLFWAQTPETGDSCEFFHKKRLDRYLDVLYYRASLTFIEGKLRQLFAVRPPA